jgi:hypothetical protein
MRKEPGTPKSIFTISMARELVLSMIFIQVAAGSTFLKN